MSSPMLNLSELRQSAMHLAQAAASFSDAAQAMAAAAQALCNAVPEEDEANTVQISTEDVVVDNHSVESHDAPGAPNLNDDMKDKPEAAVQAQTTLVEDNENDYYMSDHDEEYVHALLRRQQEDTLQWDKVAAKDTVYVHTDQQTAAKSSSPKPHRDQVSSSCFPKRILVQSEADILATVCALAQQFDKVFCYLHWPLRSLGLYQKIIKDVSRTFVYSMTLQSPNRILEMFDKQSKAVMIFHETFDTKIVPRVKNRFCIIHTGWPRSVERYKAQITFQETPNVFLVAPSEGKGLYASSAQLLQHTTSRGDSGVAFPGGEITTMESRLQASLSTVADNLKEKAYMDWIETHSRGGQRYMPSWTPAMMAQYANEYILGVLQYKVSLVDSLSGTPEERLLPLLPAQFVSQHQLEEAVEEGLLEMAIDDSGINHGSHLPSDTQQGRQGHKYSYPDVLRVQKYSYILRDEYDLIPTACALVGLYDKLMCYATGSPYLIKLIKKLILGTNNVDVLTVDAVTPAETARVINTFNAKERAVLLLREDTKLDTAVLPPKTSCILHIGWPVDYSNYDHQTTHYPAHTAILIACIQDVDAFPSGLTILGQVAPFRNRAEVEATKLPALRLQVERLLGKETVQTKEQIYREWINDHGPHGQRRVASWSPITLALRANDYLLNALRYNSGSTSLNTPPGGLPALPKSFVEDSGLQQAAVAGILNILIQPVDEPHALSLEKTE
ncbi:hypothetical protein RhiJN_18269 [Ceratobasidium sp. AG-Ba]|nr:hypothetical protein RhiJN_18269 [Ceratobasidium sp. AG-Ba]